MTEYRVDRHDLYFLALVKNSQFVLAEEDAHAAVMQALHVLAVRFLPDVQSGLLQLQDPNAFAELLKITAQ